VHLTRFLPRRRIFQMAVLAFDTAGASFLVLGRWNSDGEPAALLSPAYLITQMQVEHLHLWSERERKLANMARQRGSERGAALRAERAKAFAERAAAHASWAARGAAGGGY
jgi:hypothetical protein